MPHTRSSYNAQLKKNRVNIYKSSNNRYEISFKNKKTKDINVYIDPYKTHDNKSLKNKKCDLCDQKLIRIFDKAYDEIRSTYEYLYPRHYEVELLKEYIQNNEIDRKYARENALNQLEGNINNLNSNQYKEAIEEI
ncbi:4383_t:CDS:2, partial [Gigaspora margarita]